MRKPIIAAVTALVLLGTACATAGGGSRSSSDVITAEELSTLDDMSAYRAIEQLRPVWLRSRGRVSLGSSAGSLPRVIVDGASREELDALRRIWISDVQSLRYLSSSEATTRYGTGFPSGAIEVRTRS